jgi:hypothetical protein
MKRRILREELLEVLKQARKDKSLGEELLTVMDKIRKQEKLKSHEFLRIYELLYKEGPKVQYRNPSKWGNFDTT